MTKQEFIDRVADKANLSKREAAQAVDAFLDSISEVLREGGEVTFTGFGKFTTQRRAARQGVNPRNPSQRVHIPATTVPKFSAGSQLKRAVKLERAQGGLADEVATEDAGDVAKTHERTSLALLTLGKGLTVKLPRSSQGKAGLVRLVTGRPRIAEPGTTKSPVLAGFL